MKCKKCGYEVTQEMVMCPNCGEALSLTETEVVESDPVENIPSENQMEDDFFEVKKKHSTGLILTILLITVLLVAGVWYGIQLLSSPKNIMLTNFSKLAGYVVDTTNMKDQALLQFIQKEQNIDADMDVTVKLPSALNLGIENIQLKLNYIDHFDEQKSQISFDATADSQALIGVEGLLDSSQLYFRAVDSMDHFYYTNFDYMSLFSYVDDADYSVLTNIFIDVMHKNMSDDEITKSEVTVTLGETEEKLKKYTFAITPEKMKQIELDLLEQVRNDSAAKTILENLMSLSEEELDEKIDALIAEVEAIETTKQTTVDLSVYVRGMNEVLITELSSEEGSIQYQEYDETYKLIMKTQVDDESITYEITSQKDGDHYVISGDMANQISFQGTVSVQDGTSLFDITVTTTEIELNFDFTATLKEVTKDIEYESTLDGTVTATTGGASLEFGLASRVTVKKSNGITLDVTGAKDVNDLTEDEMAQFQEELMNIPIVRLVFSLFMGQSAS